MEIQLPCLELLVVALLPRNLDIIALTTDNSGFGGSWHKKYPWLLYNSEEHSMYCQLCIKYKKLPRNGSGKWLQ